jgi:hypothetical protein
MYLRVLLYVSVALDDYRVPSCIIVLLHMWQDSPHHKVHPLKKNPDTYAECRHKTGPLVIALVQGRPLGGASGALAPGADFEGAPKRQSPTGHTLIRSTLVW